MFLSIVTTLYYSAPYLEEFYTRSCNAARKITDNYEIIFVNDGSPDASLAVALQLYQKDKRVRIIDLSRNFGHHKAMMTGLAHAKGDLVFLIDCDLEEEPELLDSFYNTLNQSQADVVYGVQLTRKGDLFERITGKIFYFFFNLLSDIQLPSNLITVRLMTNQYVASLIKHRERELMIAGLWTITGYTQIPIVVKKHSKKNSTYRLGWKIAHFVNAIVSFSGKPLIYIFYLGVFILLISSMAAMYLTIKVLFFSEVLAGWPSLIISMWLLGGLTIFCMGTIGIYLAQIFVETKQRPYTIIRKVYQEEKQNEF